MKKDSLEKIANSHKDLWAVIYTNFRLFEVEYLIERLTNEITIVEQIDCKKELLAHNENKDPNSEFNLILKKVLSKKQDPCSTIKILINNFEVLKLKEQCHLIKSARTTQEEQPDVMIQFIFFGKWALKLCQKEYKKFLGLTNSFPSISELYIQPYTVDEVISLLIEENLIGNTVTDIDRVASEFIIENTSGDEFLTSQIIERIKTYNHNNWASYLEQAIKEITDTDEVKKEIKKRYMTLNPDARNELQKILRTNSLERDIDSVVIEELFLSGFVRIVAVGNSKNIVLIAGKIIDNVLRELLFEEQNIILFDQLCSVSNSVLSLAFNRISRIEVLLRNVVVSYLYQNSGNNWTDCLRDIKCKFELSDEYTSEEKVLFLKLIDERLAALGIDSGKERDKCQSQKDAKKTPPMTLLGSVSDWKKRRENHHFVDLTNYSLMQFLTTGDLINIITHPIHGICGKGRPFEKKELIITKLNEYIEIRSAIAHNQAVKLSVINRIDQLYQEIVKLLTVYADRS
jgi:hypothetical protein